MEIYGEGFQYALENRLIRKLDLMIDRCTKDSPIRDAVLINEGAEGEGKTTASVAEAYYIQQKTGREAHLFFRLEPLIKFAKKTSRKIIIWDEPALDSLSTDQLKEINKNMIRLLMTARKKQHFFIINLTKFWKFSEYLVVDRSLGLIHIYSRKEILPGRFVYIKKKNLEYLWNDYRKSKKRNYKGYASFHGNFPDVMTKHFDKMDFHVNFKPHATFKDYDDAKDVAINQIGTTNKGLSKKEDKLWRQLNGLKFRITKMDALNKDKIAKQLKLNRRTIQEWVQIRLEDTDLLGKRGF